MSRLSARLRRVLIRTVQHHPALGELLVEAIKSREGFSPTIRKGVRRDEREVFAVPPGGVSVHEHRKRAEKAAAKAAKKPGRAAYGTARTRSGRLWAEEYGQIGVRISAADHAQLVEVATELGASLQGHVRRCAAILLRRHGQWPAGMALPERDASRSVLHGLKEGATETHFVVRSRREVNDVLTAGAAACGWSNSHLLRLAVQEALKGDCDE